MEKTDGTIAAIPLHRKESLDFVRVLATFFIVLLHTSANDMYRFPVASATWNVLNFFNASGRWAVPAFVMISGALFLDQAKSISFAGILKRNIFRLLTVYFFWSLVYSVIQNTLEYDHFNIEVLKRVLLDTLSGPVHFWFIPMICGLYLITPFLRVLVSGLNKNSLLLLIILCLLFTSVLSMFRNLQFAPHLVSFLGKFNMSFVGGYTGCFLIGHYIYTYDCSKTIRRIIYIAGIFSFILTVLGTYFLSLQAGKLDKTFYNNLSPNCILMAISIILLFKSYEGSRPSRHRDGMLNTLSRCSFGIYILHIFGTVALTQAEFVVANHFPILSIPIAAMILYLASLFLSFVLSKIPLVNKYLM